MEYRKLGRCGLDVSVLSLGGWTTFGGTITNEVEARRLIRAAFDAGINFFDIADVYSKGESERVMGRAMADIPRRHLVISTKCYWPMSERANDRGLSRKHIFESVHDSLKRIGTDYLDLFFCHRFDPDTPLEETVRALDDLVRQGKVLYWGTSEWTGAQLRDAHLIADRRHLYAPQVEQPQYNLVERRRVEEDVGPMTSELAMGMVVWSPLASGVLSGKYDEGVPTGSRLARIDWLREKLLLPDILAAVRKLEAIATRLGCTRAQLALAWLRARPGVSSIITGATSMAQLEENLASLAVEIDVQTGAELEHLFPRVRRPVP